MNPFDFIKNAQSIKEQLAKVQDELKVLQVTGSAGGNIVRVTINGQFQVVSVDLDPIAVDPRDVPMLQDLIVAASRDAYSRMLELNKERLGPMLGGLNIPGMGM
ncbi:MAG: YbaB/EbfC family nucleoid-associated protein [Spirochaetaceae bacterium]|nr:YbaB/EbfC family nucleoid-associated protein [Spirochaetaceae bacterium]MBR6566132.1 YbaB/EbfC family nucleoid-associated protein [Spirochaetaceae bacterium]